MTDPAGDGVGPRRPAPLYGPRRAGGATFARTSVAVCLAAALGLGCSRPRLEPAVRPPAARALPRDRWEPGPRDVPTVYVEVAARPEARQRGLSARSELAEDHGMLFVYPYAAPRTFWMKDTLLALDIAFVRDDATVARVVTLGPGAGLPEDRVPRADSGEPVRYVLETRAGWFQRHGVRPNDRLDLRPALAGVAAE